MAVGFDYKILKKNVPSFGIRIGFGLSMHLGKSKNFKGAFKAQGKAGWMGGRGGILAGESLSILLRLRLWSTLK